MVLSEKITTSICFSSHMATVHMIHCTIIAFFFFALTYPVAADWGWGSPNTGYVWVEIYVSTISLMVKITQHYLLTHILTPYRYQWYGTAGSWSDANAACQGMGGYLAHIHNSNEMAAASSLSAISHLSAWVGLSTTDHKTWTYTDDGTSVASEQIPFWVPGLV